MAETHFLCISRIYHVRITELALSIMYTYISVATVPCDCVYNCFFLILTAMITTVNSSKNDTYQVKGNSKFSIHCI